jgi:hypothetical protein
VKRTLLYALTLALVSLAAPPAQAGDRLVVGVRLSHRWLEDSRRYGENGLDNHNTDVNFLGSLWGLDPLQRYVPAPFVEYRVVRGFGAGVAYDEARVKTLDWANDDHTATAGDGDLRLRGLQIYAFGRLRNRTRFTPFVRGGFSRYGSAFFEDPGWALPGRYFEVAGTHGWFADAGVRVALWRGIDLEASVEHSWLKDVDAKAHLQGGGGRRGSFPLRNDALRLGAAYRF